MGALGFGDYLDAGLPVAKSAQYPYTTSDHDHFFTFTVRFVSHRIIDLHQTILLQDYC